MHTGVFVADSALCHVQTNRIFSENPVLVSTPEHHISVKAEEARKQSIEKHISLFWETRFTNKAELCCLVSFLTEVIVGDNNKSNVHLSLTRFILLSLAGRRAAGSPPSGLLPLSCREMSARRTTDKRETDGEGEEEEGEEGEEKQKMKVVQGGV